MTAFADASALVKLYVPEADHEVVRQVTDLVIAQVSRVEVPAALWRKVRVGELTAADAAVLVAAFEADYHGTATEGPRFAVIATAAPVLDSAARLAAVHGLRAYDAVQLASASTAAAVASSVRDFVAFDVRLATAAAAEGLRPVPAG